MLKKIYTLLIDDFEIDPFISPDSRLENILPPEDFDRFLQVVEETYGVSLGTVLDDVHTATLEEISESIDLYTEENND